ncbi:hypothetical protein AB1E22_17750 [Buttiauxella gaviniae]|uniref:Uncharacterized protein n=1 Tax=Buttiauxella gaviniae TaxID=82990 RepID=A0ABV3NYD9_9ENTR
MPNKFGSKSNGKSVFYSPSPSSVTPIPVTSTSLQAPATQNQLFILGRNSPVDYFLIQVSSTPKFRPTVHGRFLFAILEKEPENIYCGQPYDLLNRLMEGKQRNISRYNSETLTQSYQSQRRGSDPGLGTNGHSSHPFHAFLCNNRVEIEGHTSITKWKPVLFAGDMTFNNGVLTSWTNNSGHYRPSAQLRRCNLSAKIRKMLPDHLFQECIFSDSTANGLSGSFLSRHLSDFSS